MNDPASAEGLLEAAQEYFEATLPILNGYPLTDRESRMAEQRLREANRKLRDALDLPQPVPTMTDPASAEGLREALDSITTVEDRRPAHRGKVVTHYIDEVHSLDEPCRFCAALRDHSDSGDIAQRLDEAHARGFREGYRTAAALATPARADPRDAASRIDALRKVIDRAVDGLNAVWGEVGGDSSWPLEAVISDLQKARTDDDIAQGKDWPPVVLGWREAAKRLHESGDDEPYATDATPDRADPSRARSLVCAIAEHDKCDGNAPNGPAGVGHPCSCACHATPDRAGDIDVERLARAMHDADPLHADDGGDNPPFDECDYRDEHDDFAAAIAAEYARLSTPRTETSE